MIDLAKLFLLLTFVLTLVRLEGRDIVPDFQLSWPTPNPAFAKGMGYSAFLQKTGPNKDFSSGSFGCVRNNGYKFHEGLDLYPISRDARGRAKDSIYAAMPGIVSYINYTSGHSAYGKYIVVEHDDLNPVLYSLYGHLASVDSRIKTGERVKVAQEIGKMGNSASYSIPLNRSHLHFEIGLRLTDRFQDWYDRKSFNTKNRHGNYSGFNLVGIDPLPFYSHYRKKTFSTPVDYIKTLTPEVKIRVKTKVIPDFTIRYPELCRFLPETKKWNGWECIFGPFGLPLTLQQTDLCTETEPDLKIISYDQKNENRRCRQLVERVKGKIVPAEQVKLYLELLFGSRFG